jgi:hypothetical protein
MLPQRKHGYYTSRKRTVEKVKRRLIENEEKP